MAEIDHFDLRTLSQAEDPRTGSTDFATRHPPRPRKGRPFVSQVPLDWVLVAVTAKGLALAVGMWVWHLSGCRKSRSVTVNMSKLPPQLPRRSAERGLARLEAVGLVRVERRRGRTPVVTLLDAPVREPSEE